jgi:branched-chain amino acid transport system permease protein
VATRARLAPLGAFLLLLAVFPYMESWPVFDSFLNSFRTFQGAQFGVWLVILLGLNLLTGYSGQISLGHGAFVAFGAYAAAIMMTRFGVPLVVAVPAAGLLTGAAGFALGFPALRLTGPYLAIATLAMMVAFPQILKLNGITEWTGGNHGVAIDTPHAPSLVDGFMSDRQWLYYSCVVPALALLGVASRITRSRIGRALHALRDTEIGAGQMGINVALYKMLAFGLSAFCAGIGGALFAFSASFISPQTFDVTLSITMLVMVVLGGLASTEGTIIAAVIMTSRNEIVDGFARIGLLDLPGAFVPGQQQSPDTLRGAVYGLMLITTLMLVPAGLAGLPRTLREAAFRFPADPARRLYSRLEQLLPTTAGIKR